MSRWLAQNWPGLISVQPNAGLPELVDGQTHYPLAPAELATLDGALRRRGRRQPDRRLLRHLDAAYPGAGRDAAQASAVGARPAPVARKPVWVPSVACLYTPVPLRQENAYFSIGERCNANGSKKWRELQEAHDWDGCVAMGREQVGEGSHALDICTAFVGRDEIAEMNEVMRRFTCIGERAAGDRLHRDAGDRGRAEAAWRQADHQLDQFRGWRAGRATDRLKLAKKFGAAVIALTIDEVGMAKTAEDKLRIARGWSISPATSTACRSPTC